MGFGTGWGGIGWGGALSGTEGFSETITHAESLDVWLPLKVIGAVPLNPYAVLVEFSHPLDPSYPPNFSALNYATVPPLTITGASPGPTNKSVRLTTGSQASVVYTLVVSDARSAATDPLDPTANQAVFAGFAISPTFFATAQSESRVMLSFSTAMLLNAAIQDTASYTIEDFQGNVKTVDSVTLNRPVGDPIEWATLDLGDTLDPGGYYVITISSAILADSGLPIAPPTDVFQWEARDIGQPVNIDISDFSGEVGDDYPNPRNLIVYPEQLGRSSWGRSGCTIEPLSIVGPLEARAETLVEDTTSGRHEVFQTSLTVGHRVTQSVYARAAGRSLLTFRGSNPDGAAWFDLDAGELTELSTNWAAGDPVSEVEELANGWYRCTLTRDTTAAGAVVAAFGAASDSGVSSYNGSNIAAIHLFGAEAVDESLLSRPAGQVFFSPALDATVPTDSTIQVDSVSCCTRAYDVYEFPTIPDPFPLMTWGPDMPYNASVLNSTDQGVLYAPAERLGQARVNLTYLPADTLAAAVDGPCDATLQETFDQSRVALLNVDETAGWVLYDGVGVPFICADNLTPIPAGATTNINLQP